ncbi:hypothetical protein APSETT445_009466 [Aspergillus pseudonomiae]
MGSLENGAGFPGLVAALILIGLGTGAIKSNVGPLIAEQYQSIGPRVKTLPDGEQVLSLMGIVVRPPNGSAITKAMRILWIGIRSGGNLEAARPASLEKTGVSVPWDDVFVDELKCALVACRVFERFVYPTLHRLHIKFKPISRIATGLLLSSCAMALAAGLQERM